MSQASDQMPAFGRRRGNHRIIIAEGTRIRTSIAVAPWAAMAFAIVGVAVAIGCIGAALYLVFRDQIIETAVTRQARMQAAYEDRLTALRAQIDRLNSRQLIDQDAFEARLEQLVARQKSLDLQQTKLVEILERARRAGLGLPLPPAAPESARLTPLPEATGTVTTAPRQPAAVKGSDLRPTPHAPLLERASVSARLAAVETALDRLAAFQAAAVEIVARSADADASRIEKVVSRLGLKMGAAAPLGYAPAEEPTGGPFVKVLDPHSMIAHATRAEEAMQRVVRLRATLAKLPLSEPIRGGAAITSGYGTRTDPFLGVAAMHTGIDFRAEAGEPVLATAAGKVTLAGRQGGYGLAVEIEHMQGLSTRYGHLSQVAVNVGDKIKAGDVIGSVGSTGRSTGPHLHYETRVHGEPVDPQAYLDAGETLKAYR